MSTEYAIYLRKSRADLEAEAHGEGDTLARHEHILMELAKSRNLPIGAIYREIVSGERIANRPVMQQLLQEVEEGRWKGVLVTETSRLARGDTIDQGIVAQAFKFSGTLIVTPGKTYDTTQDTDEEWMEFGLFMSRQEFRMIRRRMQAGRNAARREGRWIGNSAPYGYERYKLPGRGWSLRPVPEQAEVVRMIFDLYLKGYGYNRIEQRLNELHIPAAEGGEWSRGTIPGLLRNPAYIGCTSSGTRPNKKIIKDGQVKATRPRTHDYELYEGLHEAIIPRDIWEAVQERIKVNPTRIPGNRSQSNPLAGLVICDCCGKRMQRRPQTGKSSQTMVICTTRGCPTVGHVADDLELLVLDSLRTFLAKIEIGTPEPPNLTIERTSLAEIEKKCSELDTRMRRTFELVEDGTYTREIFLSRQAEINAEREELIKARAKIEQNIHQAEQTYEAQAGLVPGIRHVLDAYDLNASAAERNALLKQVIQSIDYHKRLRTRWCKTSDLTLTLHPVVSLPTIH